MGTGNTIVEFFSGGEKIFCQYFKVFSMTTELLNAFLDGENNFRRVLEIEVVEHLNN